MKMLKGNDFQANGTQWSILREAGENRATLFRLFVAVFVVPHECKVRVADGKPAQWQQKIPAHVDAESHHLSDKDHPDPPCVSPKSQQPFHRSPLLKFMNTIVQHRRMLSNSSAIRVGNSINRARLF